MQIIEKKLTELRPYANNPRINDGAVDAVAASIKAFGFKVPLVVTSDGEIIAGHTRLKAAQKLKLKTVPVIIADDLTPEQVKAFRLADNKVGELAGWDFEKLDLELEEIEMDMAQFGFDMGGACSGIDETSEHGNLRDRFLCPPFSILDTATKEWQNRKKTWLSLGIKSEESRENMRVSGGLSGNIPGYYDKKQKIEKRIGKKLTNAEFEHNYLKEFQTTLKNTSSGGVLSIFDPVLAEVLYYWFSFPGAKVLDPFSGGSVRGIVASFLNQDYTGVDLRDEQIKANYDNAGEIIHNNLKMPVWITGDSVNIKKLCPGEYDFIFSCPPYVDLEVYSDRPDDLSNMSWPDFLAAYREIINNAVSMLKENRFAVFVVSECRDNRGIYYNFVSETIKAFIDAGANYYNELILKNVCGSVPIRAARNFIGARKIGRIHQNVLVFFKGDVKKIKSIYGEVSIAEIEKEVEEI